MFSHFHYMKTLFEAVGPEQVSPHYETLSRSRRGILFMFFYIGTFSTISRFGGWSHNEWLRGMIWHHEFLIAFYLGYAELYIFLGAKVHNILQCVLKVWDIAVVLNVGWYRRRGAAPSFKTHQGANVICWNSVGMGLHQKESSGQLPYKRKAQRWGSLPPENTSYVKINLKLWNLKYENSSQRHRFWLTWSCTRSC